MFNLVISFYSNQGPQNGNDLRSRSDSLCSSATWSELFLYTHYQVYLGRLMSRYLPTIIIMCNCWLGCVGYNHLANCFSLCDDNLPLLLLRTVSLLIAPGIGYV